MQAACRGDRRANVLDGRHRLDRRDRISCALLGEQALLVRSRRIAHAQEHREAVKLGLGQREGAFKFDRILRGDHHERRLQRVRLAIDGDLAFLHRLKQRRLRLRRGAIGLIDEDEVREDRTGTEAEEIRALVVHLDTGDVARQQIRRALHPRERESNGAGDRSSQRGLADTWHVLDQQVPLGDQGHQRLVNEPGRGAYRSIDCLPDTRHRSYRRGSPLLCRLNLHVLSLGSPARLRGCCCVPPSFALSQRSRGWRSRRFSRTASAPSQDD